jgi:ribose transport system permease protein
MPTSFEAKSLADLIRYNLFGSGNRVPTGLGAKFLAIFIRYNVFLMLVVLVIASSLLSNAFLTTENVFNLLRQLTPLTLVSMGMLLVVLTGGIDLSVGSLTAVGGMVVAMLLPIVPSLGGGGLLIGVIAAMVAGAVLGAVTGYLVAVFRMAPFVASLAMMTIARGIAFMMSNGQPVRFPRDVAPADVLRNFGNLALPALGIPYPVILALVCVVLFAVVMTRTKFGRLIIATGSNETAVRLAGIPVGRYKFLVYVIAGCLSALGGVVATARTAVGTPITGVGLELDAIAACVIGGALLSGGKGSVVHTVIGVLVLGLIGNIMNLLSVPPYPQQLIKGAIIIFAVLLQNVTRETRST